MYSQRVLGMIILGSLTTVANAIKLYNSLSMTSNLYNIQLCRIMQTKQEKINSTAQLERHSFKLFFPNWICIKLNIYCTLSLHSRSKHFDFGGVHSRVRHHLSRETRDCLSSILQQQGVHARSQRDVGHRVGPVFVIHNLSLRFCTWNMKLEFVLHGEPPKFLL